MRRVVRWVERRELVAERELVPAVLDDVAHVVPVERGGELYEGPAHHIARGEGPGWRVVRRERRWVAIDGHGLLVTRDDEHPVVGLPPRRAPVPHPVEVRVGVVLDGSISEEVDVLELTHVYLSPEWEPTIRPWASKSKSTATYVWGRETACMRRRACSISTTIPWLSSSIPPARPRTKSSSQHGTAQPTRSPSGVME